MFAGAFVFGVCEMQKIEAVIFDCDGVLVDSEVLSMRGEIRRLGELNVHYTHEEFVRRFVGLHDGAFFEQLRADYETANGTPAPDDFDEQVLDARRAEMHALTAIDGAEKALDLAREKYGTLAVASSSRAQFLVKKLERTGLAKFAGAHVYSADLVNAGKPAPDIFLYAADKIQVAPENCLVLEDSENGVRAGLAANMKVWGFVGGGHCYDGYADKLFSAGAEFVAPDYAGFCEALRAL